MKTFLIATDTNFESGKLTGAHKRLLELAKGLARTDKVIMVSFSVPQLKGIPNIEFIELEKTDNKYIPANIKEYLQISKTLRKKQLDYDYAISFGPLTTCAYKKVNCHNIVSMFRENLIDYQAACGASWLKIKYYSIIEKIAVKASDIVIVQNLNDRNRLIERTVRYCRNISEKTKIQINNINTSWMKIYDNSKHENNEIPVITFIGNFNDRRKGHHILLPAVERLINENIKLKLLVAGDGIELEECVNIYGKYDGIKFLGHVNDMESVLYKSDILIVPSLIDSCPNTILEGLNAGLAVYGARAGGIPDLLLHDEYMFETNSESIYELLKDVLKSKKYLSDAENQKEIKNMLNFDWAEKIKNIIVS